MWRTCLMSGLGEEMDVEKSDFLDNSKGRGSSSSFSSMACSICLDLVVDHGERSIAWLPCGHEFHLDCIGSAFNAKGAMQCPNCRKVEKGRWLFANGHRSFPDFNVDELVNDDLYDLSFSELPFGFRFCPFRGITTQLASLLEEENAQMNAYHDLLGSATFGDRPSTSSHGTHLCPYSALHGFPHAVHPTPSNAAETLPDASQFHRHPTSLGGPSSGDFMNSHSISATGPQDNWQPIHFLVPGSADQSGSQMSSRVPRDSSNQQRSGSFVHPHPFLHGSVSHARRNLVAPVIGDVRGHSRAHGNRMFQQSNSSSLRSTSFAPIRRTRPRGLAFVSSVPSTSSADIGGLYGFSVSGSMNRNHQEGENNSRHFDHLYWGEGFTPLPWIPAEGESQWWGPFHPQNPPQSGSSDSMSRNLNYFSQRVNAERAAQGRPENGYQRIPPPRMSPFM